MVQASSYFHVAEAQMILDGSLWGSCVNYHIAVAPGVRLLIVQYIQGLTNRASTQFKHSF